MGAISLMAAYVEADRAWRVARRQRGAYGCDTAREYLFNNVHKQGQEPAYTPCWTWRDRSVDLIRPQSVWCDACKQRKDDEHEIRIQAGRKTALLLKMRKLVDNFQSGG